VDGLETDVCLTADGDLVLLNDPLLDVGATLTGWRTSGGRRRSCAGAA
jgi:glycerophosphoryl diester phosphodiesterase